jgi:hypothetical protein
MSISFPNPRDVTLRNAQVRMEKHGEDDVPALDLALSLTGGNDLLNMLHPDLRRLVFKPLSETEGTLPLPVDDLPSIRFAQLKMPLQFGFEHAGMTLDVYYGTNDKKPAMVFGACTMSKPRVEQLIEGGSVELRFNVSTKDVNEKTIGKMLLLQGHTITVRLRPPEVADEKSAHEKAREEAESLFATPPQQQTPEAAFAGMSPDQPQ